MAEIQQTSDITYRVYDWDRTDSAGKKRELHTNLAQQATKIFSSCGKCTYKPNTKTSINLVDCNYFTTNIIEVNENEIKDYTHLDSFVIYMCVEGITEIYIDESTEIVTAGETILIPASCSKVSINAKNAKLLEVYIN